MAGVIVVDMAPVIQSGRIKRTYPEEGFLGKAHYYIEFELVLIVKGRNLRYEARWPRGGEVRGQGQICIAAAFQPGTD